MLCLMVIWLPNGREAWILGFMTPKLVFSQLCKMRYFKTPLGQFKTFYLFILTKVHTLFTFSSFLPHALFLVQSPIHLTTLHLVTMSPEALFGCAVRVHQISLSLMTAQSWGTLVRYFAKCLSTGICLMFFWWWDWGYGFWGGRLHG